MWGIPLKRECYVEISSFLMIILLLRAFPPDIRCCSLFPKKRHWHKGAKKKQVGMLFCICFILFGVCACVCLCVLMCCVYTCVYVHTCLCFSLRIKEYYSIVNNKLIMNLLFDCTNQLLTRLNFLSHFQILSQNYIDIFCKLMAGHNLLQAYKRHHN